MIRINLVPQDEARRQAEKQRDRQVAILVAALLFVSVCFAEFFTRRTASEVQAEAEVYRAQLAQLTKKYQEKVLLERKRKELEAKLDTIDLLERQRRGPVQVLDDLGEATPDQLWLTEMRESGGAAFLSGRGLDNQTVASFMQNLERSPYFADVVLVETKQVEEGKAKLKEFAIRSRVLYAGTPPPADSESEDEPSDEKSASLLSAKPARKSS